MLVLTRKIGEKIHIGDGVVVTVLSVQGQRCRIGIEAPTNIGIRRAELPSDCHRKNVLADSPPTDVAAD
jgi:carbon storage regulator